MIGAVRLACLLGLLTGPAVAQGVLGPAEREPLPGFVLPLDQPEGWIIPAQTRGEPDGDQQGWKRDDDYSGSSGNGRGESLNRGVTRDIVAIVRHANLTCNDDRVELRYRIDCLRVYYGWAADSLPDKGEYLPVKKALRTAEKKLSAIVSANIDRSAPVITPREGHKKNAKKLPPLRPIKKSAEKKAVAQAEAVVKEAELVILRSGEDPARREEHFDAVAEAVDSNLVILRSA